MSEENSLYRPINLQNISKGSNLTFDVYYESNSVGGTYVKFASADNPRHQEKVKEFLSNPDFNIQLYIEEERFIQILRSNYCFIEENDGKRCSAAKRKN